MKKSHAIAVLVLAFVSPHLSLRAQSTNATITGRVVDPTKAVVVDAKIEVTNVDTNIISKGATNTDGLFTVSNLPPGNYRVSVMKQGFRSIVKPDVILHVQDVIALNFDLALGSQSEVITVEGGAPVVDTQSAAVGTVVDRQFVENLPLNGRSFQTLITLAPGVVLTPATYNQEGQFSVDGQRADANYLTVDGVSANTAASTVTSLRQDGGGAAIGYTASGGTNGLVSVDAMQEFRIQTSSFAPEFGRTPGAQISIVTRSGTNDFHGTAFDYFRNAVLDANNWFADANNQPKPTERQNDFGGVFGGPIIKDKTFFFVSYEGLRLQLPRTTVTSVPSLAARAAASASTQPLLDAFPMPNGALLAGGLAQFTGSYADPSSLDSGSVRVDHSFNSKFSLFGRYSYATSDVTQRAWNTTLSVLSNPSTVSIKSQVFTLGLAETLSPSLSNEVRFNFTWTQAISAISLDTFGGATPPPNSLLYPSFTTPSAGVFAAYILGAGQFQDGNLAQNQQRQINFVDNLSKTIGSHQLKFGVDYRRLFPISEPFSYLQEPIFFSLASAETDTPAEATIEGFQKVAFIYNNYSFYAQDTWKATSRMTLTYGLRWDINPAPHGAGGLNLTALENVNNPATINIAPTGTPLYKTTYGNVAPRIGVAYQVFQHPGRETVVRGGFGIFYDLGYGDTGLATGSTPFGSSKVLVGDPFPFTAAQAALPPFSLTPPYSGVTAADPNLVSPRSYQWNFAIEQSLGSNQSVSVTYLGALGRDLLRSEEYYLPNANFSSGVVVTTNSAISNYNALQVQFKRRLSHGLQALGSYTWSHSLDDASADSSTYNTSNFYNPMMDYGSSDFDVRNSFTAAINYDIPSSKFWGAVGSDIFHGWAVDTYFLAYSALPVDLIGTTIFTPPQISILRPNVTGQPFYLYGPQYPGGKAFNAAAFSAPAAGQQGSLGRNVLRGFGAWQDDFAVRRQFPITEKVNLQFRAEIFNIFNHPNFGPPGNTLGTPLFGLSSETYGANLGTGGLGGGFSSLYQVGGPRSIQLALKLGF